MEPITERPQKGTQTTILTTQITEENVNHSPRFRIVNLWDYLKFREDTQAYHISHVLSFDEWTAMDEILRRVKELFQVEYKNERSLYPYLKTLVDSGLLEVNVAGGKMRWRKKTLMISLEEEEEAVVPASAQSLQ
ncbi:MAG: hypothetical protein Q8P05_00060 [Candidatus Diapherotrites archaeon]|nr:hypothetical protein [Candidatus Diapherotrites archaeon]